MQHCLFPCPKEPPAISWLSAWSGFQCINSVLFQCFHMQRAVSSKHSRFQFFQMGMMLWMLTQTRCSVFKPTDAWFSGSTYPCFHASGMLMKPSCLPSSTLFGRGSHAESAGDSHFIHQGFRKSWRPTLKGGCGAKLIQQQTTGFSRCFHLPAFQFGYLFLDPRPGLRSPPVEKGLPNGLARCSQKLKTPLAAWDNSWRFHSTRLARLGAGHRASGARAEHCPSD